ncbi:MAG: PTS sugar transporter subunit IIA [Propionibacteriaceae bacterium]|jgi:mannose/fructose/sorbose-specific phosphotransferase system IIA component|nr:PTS sugar transporter subunit IIA [Micropruina sp.]HBX80163.1 PTS mannose transporter subunit IID [Propionibacteriaceae bacterium]HBY21888.1 PTS mannose transporter subunit IID [Propionibacteriaceae bacterium]
MPPIALIVAAHGNLAPALLESAAMIAGTIEKAAAITFAPSEGPDDLLAKYEEAVNQLGETDVLFLVDLFGGSPYNAAARFVAPRGSADILTGVNLPILIEVLARRQRSGVTLTKLVKAGQLAGQASVRVFSESYTPTTTTTSSEEGDEL